MLWWMLRDHPEPGSATPPRPAPGDSSSTTLNERTSPEQPDQPPGVTVPAPENNPPPIIDEVILEKQEVCEGEENLVTVRAHTADGTDEWLHYTIGAGNGPSVPIRRFREEEAERTITVFGKNNVSATVQIPPYTLKDCTIPRTAFIEYRMMPNAPSEFELYARLVDLGAKTDGKPAPAFTPSSYEWDFGDGETATTAGPVVTHSFEGRAQDTYTSFFLIKVTVHGSPGDPIMGRTSLQMFNPAFENLKFQGTVVLFTSMNPRFPKMDDRGMVTQQVRIWHYRPDSVLITSIKVMRYEIGTGEYGPLENGNVEQILGSTRIPPGQGLETTLHFDARKEKSVAYLTYWLEGVSSEGYPVRGNITLMRPPDNPTKDNSNPVLDPVLLAKVKEARRILNQEYVTDEDIWRLEKEGYFANLQVDSSAVPPAPPPRLPKPYRPPPPDAGDLPEGYTVIPPPKPTATRR